MDDDLRQRFDDLSLTELRRRVDLALRWVRELRSGLAVHAGMTLEQIEGPIPELDPAQAEKAFGEIIAMLPLLRRPLTAEEKANLIVPTPAQREQMKEALDELVAAHEDDDGGAPEDEATGVLREQLIKVREGLDKSEMIREIEREMRAFVEELLAYREALTERAAAAGARISAQGGEG
jgi:hypothetical protein